MATYRLSVSTVSRSTGRSAVAAAAYRSATRLTNERDGRTHDYRGRGRDVLARGILVPDHAPAWAGDRAQLWNAAEAAENRKNSVTARELQLSLPHELTHAQRLELVREFCGGLVERYGVAVDFAIHRPDTKGDNRNHHAHVLMTTRRMQADGLGQKPRELDDRSRHADGSQPRGPQEVEYLRRTWCDMENHALEKLGLAERVDHRSYERQGIEREPEPRLGPHAHAMEERGEPTVKARWRRAVQSGDVIEAERAAIAYHVRQVDTHGDKTIPERGRSPRHRQWPYQTPPHRQAAIDAPRAAFGPLARPDAPNAPAATPVDPVREFAERPLAKSWREHYDRARQAAAELAELQEWQTQRLARAHAPPASGGARRTGLSRVFERVKQPASERQSHQRYQEALKALAKDQAAERAAFAERERAQRRALGRSLARMGRDMARQPAEPSDRLEFFEDVPGRTRTIGTPGRNGGPGDDELQHRWPKL